MKNSNNEPMKLTKSRIREPEAVAVARRAGEDVKNRAEKRVEVGKGGCEIGKWCSFSHFETALTHLFPHDSAQVVDFPHICNVRVFGEMRRNHRDTETQSQEEERDRMDNDYRHNGRNGRARRIRRIRVLVAIFVTERSPMFA